MKYKVFIYDQNEVYVDTVVSATDARTAENIARNQSRKPIPPNALVTATPLSEFNKANS